jgi:DNA-binding response OmpR family regulator
MPNKVLASGLNGLRVVVAEDDFLIAQHLEDLLLERGASTRMVSTVSELMSMDLSGTDVAILDSSLLDGSVETGAARLAEAGIPLIYQSGREAGEINSSGSIGILTKPVNEGELLRLLASVKPTPA